MPATTRRRKIAVPPRTIPNRDAQKPRPIRIRKVILRSASKKPSVALSTLIPPYGPLNATECLDAPSGCIGISVHAAAIDFESDKGVGRIITGSDRELRTIG